MAVLYERRAVPRRRARDMRARRIIAAIDDSPVAALVVAAADAVAELFGHSAEALHVCEDGHDDAAVASHAAGLELRTTFGPVAAALSAAAGEDDVAALVLSASSRRPGGRPVGHLALDVVTSLDKPLVVVPTGAAVRPPLRRVLVPLDGTVVTSEALRRAVELSRARDAEVVALHVHPPDRVPPFADQPHHEAEAWGDEFLRRYRPNSVRMRLQVRVGEPATQVLAAADEAGADLVVLGWSRDLSPGRAAVVRAVLLGCPVPVLLAPVTPDAERVVAVTGTAETSRRAPTSLTGRIETGHPWRRSP